ncbi:MAG: hypothetical protein C0606_12835 [Hyphomicrobiales bacterium]|nr:MAG: hypothetical protein C0606_12835 [Hyphomicrobiales bacterium]
MSACFAAALSILIMAGPALAGEGDRIVQQPGGSYRLEATYLAPNGCYRIESVEIKPVMQSGYAPVIVEIGAHGEMCTMALKPLMATATLPPHHALRGALVDFRQDGRLLEQRRVTIDP